MNPTIGQQKALTLLAIVLACTCTLGATAPTAKKPVMICHPGLECYPKLFEPATYWRTIHDDQEIPAGLHVRLNMATGAKEAKLLDDEETENTFLDLAYPDSDTPRVSDEIEIVIGEGVRDTYEINYPEGDTPAEFSAPESEDKVKSSYSGADADFDFDVEGFLAQLPAQPKGYTHKPNLRIPASDHSSFKDALKVISSFSSFKSPKSSSTEDLVDALSVLAELAHELDFGISLTKAPEALMDLLALTGTSVSSNSATVRELAARTIGAALYNNPVAQQGAPLSQIVQTTLTNLKIEPDALVRTRLVYVLSSIVSSPHDHGDSIGFAADGLTARDIHAKSPIAQYAIHDGGATLRALFRDSKSATNSFRAKCATFVHDTFANPDIYDTALDFNLRVRNTDDLMNKKKNNNKNGKNHNNQEEENKGWWMDETTAWAVEFQNILVKHATTGVSDKLDTDTRDKIYTALKSIQKQYHTMRVSAPFMNWMISVAKGAQPKLDLKARGLDVEEEYDDEVLFANMINEDRHVVFGNPNGYRKNMSLDIGL